jgi:Fe-S cluster assembly protein SufD
VSDVASQFYADEFERVESLLPGAGNIQLDDQRKKALEYFLAQGLPTTRQENWKYTSLAALEKKPLPLKREQDHVEPSLAEILEVAVLPQAEHRLVFVDGRFAPALSKHALAVGVRAGALSSRVADRPDEGLPLSSPNHCALVSLGLALSEDGLDLTIPAGVSIHSPILVMFVSASAGHSVFPASAIHLAEGARVTLVEQHIALHNESAFAQILTRVTLDQDADLTHVKLQVEGERTIHLADTEVDVAARAQYHSVVLALGASIGREDLRINLNASGAHADLDGAYLPRKRMHLDHHTTVRHVSPNCTSRQSYRGILDEAGRGVFNGRVVVEKDAQHTDAQQSNANLLLSENAEIDTKPQLEIFADDVKCSHGATVGQLDPAELFYLRSRGIDEAAARALVTFAFAARVLSSLESQEALYSSLRKALFTHLPGGSVLEDLSL